MAAYKTLRPYPALHFFANIIDPKGKHKIDDVIAAVKKKFNIESTNRRFINTLLKDKCERKSKADLFAEIHLFGAIQINHCYTEYSYKEHTLKLEEFTALEVNSKVIEKIQGFDVDKMSKLVDDVKTMFSAFDEGIFEKDDPHWADFFEQIWAVFPKGVENYQMDHFCRCVNILNEYSKVERFRECDLQCAMHIRDEYFKYLWTCYEEEKLEQYIKSLSSFISDNIEFWKNGEDKPSLELKIYTEEHQEAIKLFMREPALPLGTSINILILKVWKALENNDATLT